MEGKISTSLSRSVTVLALLMLVVSAWAQGRACRLVGQVTDSKGKGISAVNIYVVSGGNQYAGITAIDGTYEVRFEAVDTITVGYRHVSYQPFNVTMSTGGKKEILKSVNLEDGSTELEGVTVESELRLMRDGKVLYLPTRRQQAGAHDGMGLLFNMMIPQIEVSRLEGTITATDMSKLCVCIDGREVNVDEVKAIRSKDVARVEYDDKPKGEFAAYSKVINIITRKCDHGGYVDFRTKETFIDFRAENSLQASIDQGKVNILARLSSDYITASTAGTHTFTRYVFAQSFTKDEIVDAAKRRVHREAGALRTTYRGKRNFLMATAGLNWNYNLRNDGSGRTVYDNAPYADGNYQNRQRSRSLTPSVEIFDKLKIDDTQVFRVQLGYNYSSNWNESAYEESGFEPVYSKADEGYHVGTLFAAYSKSFKHNNTLGVDLKGVYQNTTSHYGGNYPSTQRLNSVEGALGISYNQFLFNRLMLSVSLACEMTTYRSAGYDRVTDVHLQPQLYLYYQVDKSSSINTSWSYSTVTPSMSSINDAERLVSAYEIIRGNPDLELNRFWNGQLAYNKNFRKFSLSVYGTFTSLVNMPRQWSYADGDMMVTSQFNTGNYYKWDVGASLTARLSKGFNAKVSGIYNQAVVNGLGSAHKRWMYVKSSLYYNIGEFSFTGEVFTQQNGMREYCWYKYLCRYGMTASWSHKGLFVEVGCRQLFNKDKVDVWTYDAGDKYETRFLNARENNRKVYVSMSYSFDFGRKLKRENVNVKSGRNGLLSM